MAPKELDAEVLRRVSPRDYLKRFIDNDVRPDGRNFSTARKLTMTTGSINTAVGSAMLKVGRTTAVAGVQATLVPPAAGASSGEGVLEISAEILPTAVHATTRTTRSSEDALVLTHYLQQWLEPIIDREMLCVRQGDLVWYLRLSIYCIDNDGNMHDVAAMAAVAALRDVRLPTVTMLDDVDDTNGDDGDPLSNVDAMSDAEGNFSSANDRAIAVASTERTISLQVEDFPVAVSFVLFEDKPLIDPTAEEEEIAENKLTFVLTPTCDLRAVIKPGGKPLSGELYNACLSAAKTRAAFLIRKLNKG